MSLFRLASVAVSLLAVHAQVYTAEYQGSSITYTVTQDTGPDVPLASKRFDYPYLPYQADTGNGPRGRMQGYNLCNSTTAGQDSLCSTMMFNGVNDFCLWGAPGKDQVVGNIEGEMVAYCTDKKYGARVIPAGAITGLQFIKTPGYIQLAGYIDQTALGLQANDTGGEEDPHGADQRGNALGSLMYSSAFGKGPHSDYQQVIEWTYFVGGGQFCFKACDPAGPNAPRLCEHVYDRIGCTYNQPLNYAAIQNSFSSCEGENALPVGVYVTNGVTQTWQQPPESDGPITSIPYTPAIPATSQCTTHKSDELFTSLTTISVSSSLAAPSSASTSSDASASLSVGNQAASSQAANATDSSSAIQIAACSLTGLFAAAAGFMLF